MKEKPSIVINDLKRIAIKADGTRMPVIDSKLTTVIQPTTEDIKNGVPGDHANCMYCLACRRMFESELVWVTRTVAYVELKGKGGKPELHRFILTDPARLAVREFDAKKDVTPEAVGFAAPTRSQCLDALYLKHQKMMAKTEKHQAYVKGKKKSYPKNPSAPQRLKPFHELRAPAHGMFQFRPIKTRLEKV